MNRLPDIALLRVIAEALLIARESLESSDRESMHYKGERLACYEAVDSIKNQLEICDIDCGLFGLSFDPVEIMTGEIPCINAPEWKAGASGLKNETVAYILELVIDNARDAATMLMENETDEFYIGKYWAYARILKRVKRQMVLYGADPSQFGLGGSL